ncbi:Ionotropic glutamate receptor [Sergentomyia squamirostris]
MEKNFWIFAASFLMLSGIGYGDSIRIGGLFDSEQEDLRLAFSYAVDIANTEILNPEHDFQLKALPVEVPFGNEYMVSKKLCRLLKSGVAAIIGPQSPTSAVHVQSICDAKEMPHIETRFEPLATGLPSLNIHPHAQTQSRVFVDLIHAFDWKSFTIIYENAPYLVTLSDLLKLYDPKGHTITVRQLDLGLQENYRAVLRRVKLSDEKNILLHCSANILPEVLKQAQQVGLTTEHHQYIITTLDLHTIDLEPYQYSGTNITGIRLIDPDDQRLIQVTDFWKNVHEEQNLELPESMQPQNIRTELALTFDSVILFADALNQMHGTKQLTPISLNCDDGDTWINGYSIVNYMKTSHIKGLTRDIKFDHKGHRTDFLLDIVELGSAGLERVATWNSTEGFQSTRTALSVASTGDDGALRNRTFIVLTALSPPYGMLRQSSAKLEGNERFEGFGIDLIHELSQMLGFNYTFNLQEDGVYGSIGANGKWNGMIRELLEYRADLAITDLTITADREGAVDFTMPFMNLGISILYRKPTKLAPSLFSFMSPFSHEVWICLGFGYMGVAICLFILGRISPGEWDNPYPCVEEPESLENQFSFRNAMWWAIGALLQQGTELAPKSPSTRAIASIWWFFTLIMVSSYTANLAAFLTVESLSPTISSAEDLANANGAVKYGAKRDGSTINFFKDAEYETYQKMYQFMQENPDLLTSSNPEGLSRVKSDNYAFLMESTSIEYIVERECDVTQVNGLLDDKGYGIAMRKNSPYRNALSAAVLKLQEQGKLTVMKIKWWKEKHGGGACMAASDDGGALALGIANVGGVFLLLFLGCIAAIVISWLEFLIDIKSRANELKNVGLDGLHHPKDLDMANVGGVFLVLLIGASLAFWYGCCEFFYMMVRRAKQHRVSFLEEFMEEMKFVAKCHGNTKIVRHRKSSSANSKISEASSEQIERGSTHSRSTDDKALAPSAKNIPDMIVTQPNGHPAKKEK